MTSSSAGYSQDKNQQDEAAAQAQRQDAMREALQKAALAESIVGQRERASGRDLDATYRADLKTALAGRSVAALTDILQSGASGPLLGESAADLVYTPVAPCRIIDTRVAGGQITAGARRDFVVAGTLNFPAQGGTSGGCGIPAGPATAVAINFVAVNPAGAGDLRAFPFGGVLPTASIVNYALPGSGLNIANGLDTKICDPATFVCTSDLVIQADTSAVHVVADVQGYFSLVSKAQVKSTHGVTQTSSTTPIGATCVNYSGGSITVTAPVAGKIFVRASVVLIIGHATGTEDRSELTIGTTPTDCSGPGYGFTEYSRITASLPSGAYEPWLHPSREFSVSPGTFTYYLNGITISGVGTFWYATMEATFIPN